MTRNKLPLETPEEYEKYLKHHPEALRQPRYMEEMRLSESLFQHERFLLELTKLDVWLMRLVMVAAVVAAGVQLYYAIV